MSTRTPQPVERNDATRSTAVNVDSGLSKLFRPSGVEARTEETEVLKRTRATSSLKRAAGKAAASLRTARSTVKPSDTNTAAEPAARTVTPTKTAQTKPVAKKAAAKKAATKKAAAKKVAAKKAAVKKATAKRAGAKKAAAKKEAAKKAAVKKPLTTDTPLITSAKPTAGSGTSRTTNNRRNGSTSTQHDTPTSSVTDTTSESKNSVNSSATSTPAKPSRSNNAATPAGASKPARKNARTSRAGNSDAAAKTKPVAAFVDADSDTFTVDTAAGNDPFFDDADTTAAASGAARSGSTRRDFDDDLDIVASLRDLPISDIQVPRAAKPVIDDDEFAADSSFITILDPSLVAHVDDDLDGFEDREDGEEDDEADVELLEALSSPTRPALRSTLDVPLTSSDYNDRNQELFGRRNAILARIAELEKKEAKRKLAREDADELRRNRFLLDEATKAIIEFNYGLVLNYVRKFTSTTSRDDSADFEAAGVVGLMRAVSSYDPTRGTKFSTWAYKPIQREILKAVRDADFKQLNPGDFEKRPEILRAVKALQNGDEEFIPSFEAVAAQAGATLDAVKRILNAPVIESLSAPMGEDGDTSLTDMIEDPSAAVEDTALARQEIMDLERFGLSCLDERELFVIGRRFGLDGEPPQRLSAIGSLLGLSREAVRQVEAKALSKLLHPVTRRRLVRHGRR